MLVQKTTQKILVSSDTPNSPEFLDTKDGPSFILSDGPTSFYVGFITDVTLKTFTNLSSTVRFATGISGLYAAFVPITNETQVRLVGNLATTGTASSYLKLMYKTGTYVASTDIIDFSELAATGTCEISCNGTGFKDSGWVNLPEGAKTDIWIAVAEGGGDGVADPVVASLGAYFR